MPVVVAAMELAFGIYGGKCVSVNKWLWGTQRDIAGKSQIAPTPQIIHQDKFQVHQRFRHPVKAV